MLAWKQRFCRVVNSLLLQYRADGGRQGKGAAFLCAGCLHLLLLWLLPSVCGSKWSKRALGMTAPAEQLQFVWHAARYIALCSKAGTSTAAAESAADDVVAAAGDTPAGSTTAAAAESAVAHRSAGSSAAATAAAAAAAELSKLQELRDSILTQLPAEQRGHFSITLDDVQAAAAAAAAAAGGDGNDAAADAAGPSVSAISFESVADALEVGPSVGCDTA
jgi:hypothetical protein